MSPWGKKPNRYKERRGKSECIVVEVAEMSRQVWALSDLRLEFSENV